LATREETLVNVFDTVYLSAALHNNANTIMTTDTGF